MGASPGSDLPRDQPGQSRPPLSRSGALAALNELAPPPEYQRIARLRERAKAPREPIPTTRPVVSPDVLARLARATIEELPSLLLEAGVARSLVAAAAGGYLSSAAPDLAFDSEHGDPIGDALRVLYEARRSVGSAAMARHLEEAAQRAKDRGDIQFEMNAQSAALEHRRIQVAYEASERRRRAYGGVRGPAFGLPAMRHRRAPGARPTHCRGSRRSAASSRTSSADPGGDPDDDEGDGDPSAARDPLSLSPRPAAGVAP
jgi:hypothetical protein